MTYFDHKRNGFNVTDTPQYVFGYGSLIDTASRRRTNPNATVAMPAIVDNLARGWWIHGKAPGYNTCFLGVQATTGERCNGVIYPITDTELIELDNRERIYDRTLIPTADITRLDGGGDFPSNAQIWVYVVADEMRTVATPQVPIVQSYVDICLNGCFEVEETYPLAREAGYVEMFITATHDWNRYWENDRINPRRPMQFQPRAYQIDRVLKKHIPGLFEQIRLQPANWDT